MRKRAICACNFTIERIMDDGHYQAARDWLKSLHPQPLKELSLEKAIKWFEDVFFFQNNSSGRGEDYEISTHDFDSMEEMYDSFRKSVIVESQPHWKPSEEHFQGLRRAITKAEKGSDAWNSLTDLYEHLKKL